MCCNDSKWILQKSCIDKARSQSDSKAKSYDTETDDDDIVDGVVNLTCCYSTAKMSALPDKGRNSSDKWEDICCKDTSDKWVYTTYIQPPVTQSTGLKQTSILAHTQTIPPHIMQQLYAELYCLHRLNHHQCGKMYKSFNDETVIQEKATNPDEEWTYMHIEIEWIT
ncbi:unnamed protein product [Mytilus edulis]|uniref:Uncharacterized protein n=1 Tax=Mytilus edulis TaxID=6550 RepID=A0A8S3UEM5_MYTED|nr:unnamed protein product [Mytilus edulis]